MAAVRRTAEEEAAFLKDLLADLDGSFWDAVPSSDPPRAIPSPVKIPNKKKPSPPRHKQKLKTPSPSKIFSAGNIDLDAFLDGAEDWDIDMQDFELSPRKKPQTSTLTTVPGSAPWTRCTVKSITEITVSGKKQLNLVVGVLPGQERRSVALLDDWAWTDVRVDDIINVIGSFTLLTPSSSSITSTITICSKSNLLVLHPDILLTATALSNAPQCLRKPLLSALVRSTSDVTPALIWGNLLHSIVQSCLSEQRWDENWIDSQIDSLLREAIGDLAKIGFDIEQGKREIKARALGVKPFGEKYISKTPKPSANLSNTRSSTKEPDAILAITQVLDIEEDIWSPKYGLKGKLDATVETIITEPHHPVPLKGPKPLEIKTGRMNGLAAMEHRAQTMLYALMTEERYGLDVESGLLWYTQSEQVIRVPIGRNEVRGLMMVRNQMAAWMARSRDQNAFLPPTIDDERVCKRCYALDTCMLYRKAVENVIDTTSPIADLYELKTSHLSDEQCQFFKSWERLLALEEQDLTKFRRELWTMTAKEREDRGRCFSDMIMDQLYSSKLKKSRDHKIHQHEYQFVRRDSSPDKPSLLNGFINTGDAITISVEPQLLALARGFVLELTPSSVVVGVDHAVSIPNIKDRLSVFCKPPPSPVVFRIDRDELIGGMGRVRDNLSQLFYIDGDKKRLRLVVDLDLPIFSSTPPHLPPAVLRHSVDLNLTQQAAVNRVLSAEDYALILGMPGTGKTTVIASLIKTLVEMGKTVLLTSYTHSAVDTILLKLQDHADFTILRLGNVDKVHADVQKFTLAARRAPTSLEQIEQQFMTPPVVATTCLSIDHALFSRRKFDYCIVDEASQITLPTCLGPLRFADKFVLVGDHFQLPPLVRNPAARSGGLEVSLFRRLSDAHPTAVVDLSYQYRMNADIMLLSNKLIYSDRLKCGSEQVANRRLQLPNSKFLQNLHESPCGSSGCWLERLLSERTSAVFVDTDLIPARDSKVGDLVQNETEASLVYQTTEALLRSGVNAEHIGIISMYRQQLKLLGRLLHGRPGIEMLTADRSQGRDKDCIIISMVRSNEDGQIGDLVKDWRRMNVSFTRARCKLIIFGSRKTLQNTPLLGQFFELMDRQGWILQLPPQADTVHSLAKKRVPVEAKENTGKRAKTIKTAEGILRSRPILKDLVNGQ